MWKHCTITFQQQSNSSSISTHSTGSSYSMYIFNNCIWTIKIYNSSHPRYIYTASGYISGYKYTLWIAEGGHGFMPLALWPTSMYQTNITAILFHKQVQGICSRLFIHKNYHRKISRLQKVSQRRFFGGLRFKFEFLLYVTRRFILNFDYAWVWKVLFPNAKYVGLHSGGKQSILHFSNFHHVQNTNQIIL